MMGGKTPKTCWAVNKRQDYKPENCCIWFGDLFEFAGNLSLTFEVLKESLNESQRALTN
jgi:hypothetical protein